MFVSAYHSRSANQQGENDDVFWSGDWPYHSYHLGTLGVKAAVACRTTKGHHRAVPTIRRATAVFLGEFLSP